jgi:ParB family transcriptional regulator, chromosome partitioning protein
VSRPESERARSELDALLANRTPVPADGRSGDDTAGVEPRRVSGAGGAREGRDDGLGADGGAPSAVPLRGRLEAWLRPTGASPGDVPTDGPANGGSAGSAGGVTVGGLGELRDLAIDSIRPNAYQPRQHFDDDALESLADSIRELGVLQPVLVRPDTGVGGYELVAGERRWRAARLAGMRMIPALIREAGDQGSLEQAIVENLHRQDLNPLEEAAAYQQLAEDFGLTQDAVARRVGKSRSAVANTVRLLQLGGSVQRLVGEGLLSAGHARALLAVDDLDEQRVLAERVVTEELTVRQTEEAVRRLERSGEGGIGSSTGGDERQRSASAIEVERLLADHLETQVDLRWRGGGGQVVIRFADGEDLDRIVRTVVGEPGESLDWD